MAERNESADVESRKTSESPPAAALRILNEIRKDGINAAPTHNEEWERIVVIIDSGVSVPVMPPDVGRAYSLEDSEASRKGTEYECANGHVIPNLGQKRMPVVTSEGTLRGYTTQCADVPKPLQSVRHLVRNGHVVVVDDEGSFICNKNTGEYNQINDDGINYNMAVWVVPPEALNAIRDQAAEEQRQAADEENTKSGFTRQARQA